MYVHMLPQLLLCTCLCRKSSIKSPSTPTSKQYGTSTTASHGIPTWCCCITGQCTSRPVPLEYGAQATLHTPCRPLASLCTGNLTLPPWRDFPPVCSPQCKHGARHTPPNVVWLCNIILHRRTGAADPPQRRPIARAGRRGPDGPPPDGPSVIGRKVWRYWPNEGDNGWVKGVITDYKEGTGEHVIAYDLNTSKQSYEYYNFRLASPEEYEVVMNEPPIDLTGIKGGGASSRATSTKKKPPARSSAGIVQVGGLLYSAMGFNFCGNGKHHPVHRVWAQANYITVDASRWRRDGPCTL